MPSVSNKTRNPIAVPLPGGKTLRLGPGHTGQITAKAAENAKLKALVEAGELELADDDSRHSGGAGGAKKGRAASQGHVAGGGIRRSGDR